MTTDLVPVDEILDSGSSSPRIQTYHFNSETQLPLCGYYAAGQVPHVMQGSSENSTPRDQVTASSPNLNPIYISEEPDRCGPHSICLTTTTDTSTVTSLGLSSIISPPPSDSETTRENNKYLPCLSLRSIKRACWPDCQYFAKSSVLPISLVNQWFLQSRMDRRNRVKFSDKVYNKSHRGIFNLSRNAAFFQKLLSKTVWFKIT